MNDSFNVQAPSLEVGCKLISAVAEFIVWKILSTLIVQSLDNVTAQ